MNLFENVLRGAVVLGTITILIVLASTMLAGCNNGSNIPIDPTCVELVTDECVPEVVEEFCDVCPPPVICPPIRVCPDPETVYLCKERIKVCPKTFCYKWGGDCCHYETTWVECEGPEE